MNDSAELFKMQHDMIAAFIARQELPHGTALVPDGYKITSTEMYEPCRRRLRGRFTSTLVEDFSNYFARNVEADGLARAPIFISQDGLSAVALLDWLVDDDKPGHAEHVAACTPEATPEWAALLDINNRPQSQDEFVDFLEDLAPIVTAFDDKGQGMPPSAIVASFRNAKIVKQSEQAQTLEDSVVTRSAMESIDANASRRAPGRLTFHIVPYAEFAARPVVARIVTRAGANGAPVYTLRIAQLEQVKRELAAEFVNLVQKQIGGFFADNGSDAPTIYVGRMAW